MRALRREAGKKTSWLLHSVSFPKQLKWLVLEVFDYIVHENNVQCLPPFHFLLCLLACFFHVLPAVSDNVQILESMLRFWQSVWEASESNGLPMPLVTFRIFAVSYFQRLFMERRFWKVMAFCTLCLDWTKRKYFHVVAMVEIR